MALGLFRKSLLIIHQWLASKLTECWQNNVRSSSSLATWQCWNRLSFFTLKRISLCSCRQARCRNQYALSHMAKCAAFMEMRHYQTFTQVPIIIIHNLHVSVMLKGFSEGLCLIVIKASVLFFSSLSLKPLIGRLYQWQSGLPGLI